jgi:fatty-acyl-CoA synthase
MTALATDPIRWWSLNAPDRPAIVYEGDDVVTYRVMDQWSDTVAARLAAAGVAPGDRVGIVGPNTLEWCAGALGALKAGAVVAAYNHRFGAAELAYLVADSGPTVVLADEGHRERLEEVAAGGVSFELLGLGAVRELRTAAPVPFARLDVDPDAPAVIVYTSGTTANPKGVVFTHRTILSFVSEWGLMEPALRPGVRMIFLLSLGAAPGILWGVLHILIRGGTLYLEPAFDPASALERMVKERIEVMMGVPLLFEQIAALPQFEAADLSSVVCSTVGGARVSRHLLEAWLAKGVTLRQIYGMTELGGTSTANPPAAAAARPESVGRGSMFTRHRVVRPDGTDCRPGEAGEIIVQGPSVTPGYWNNPAATAEALRDGWFHSGDVGCFDEDGYLYMVDRLKDMIISGGYNIAPSELESVIAALPGVEEVAVIPVADATYGETPAALVRRAPEAPVGVGDVLARCDELLASYKQPRYVVFVDEPLPRMPSGKVAKRQLRDTYADLPATHPKAR